MASEALKVNASLQTIILGDPFGKIIGDNMYGNNIGDAGAAALAEALQHNTSLNTIDLRGNKIGNDGAKALAEVRR